MRLYEIYVIKFIFGKSFMVLSENDFITTILNFAYKLKPWFEGTTKQTRGILCDTGQVNKNRIL